MGKNTEYNVVEDSGVDTDGQHDDSVKNKSTWGKIMAVLSLFLLGAIVGVMGLFGWQQLDARVLNPTPESPYHYTAEQWSNFNIAYDVVQVAGGDHDATVATIMAVLAETGGINYANTGESDHLADDQNPEDIAESLGHPWAQAEAADAGSMGILQQQYPWWGTVDELMDPHTAVGMFYEEYEQVSGDTLPERVQAVQLSAYLDGSNYAEHEEAAEMIVDTIEAQRLYSGVLVEN